MYTFQAIVTICRLPYLPLLRTQTVHIIISARATFCGRAFMITLYLMLKISTQETKEHVNHRFYIRNLYLAETLILTSIIKSLTNFDAISF